MPTFRFCVGNTKNRANVLVSGNDCLSLKEIITNEITICVQKYRFYAIKRYKVCTISKQGTLNVTYLCATLEKIEP